MRYFYGLLALITAILLMTQPAQKEILAAALIVGGILALMPNGEIDES